LVARVPYSAYSYRAADVVRRLARARPDVVFVSAYLQDGVAIRRELVKQHVPLLANIGTSSSYCMPAFGRQLGPDAVGVFASDKPATEYMNLNGLDQQARALALEANRMYRSRYHTDRRGVRSGGVGLLVSVRARAAGLVVIAAYVGGAVLSGHLSPFARRPLFDGVITSHPYNWVHPPPALAATNKQAESGTYD